MKEVTVPAKKENLDSVVDFVSVCMEEEGFSLKQVMQTSLAVEEIFINIASYAYSPGHGDCVVRVKCELDIMTIEFSDSGTPFNPLLKEDPDTSLIAEERGIGGLGVFISKKVMDGLEYEYSGGKNIIKLLKNK